MNGLIAEWLKSVHIHSERKTNNSIIIHCIWLFRFSINILLATMSIILQLFLMTNIYICLWLCCFWYSVDTIHITYKVYYRTFKNIYHIISTFLKEKHNDWSMLIYVKYQLWDDEYLEVPWNVNNIYVCW